MNHLDFKSQQWLVLAGDNLVLNDKGRPLWEALPFESDTTRQCFLLDGPGNVVAVDVEPALVEAYQTLSIREGIVGELLSGGLLHQAASLVNWGRQTRFCSCCGSTLTVSVRRNNRARSCDDCGFQAFPVVSPCIIVLIYRDDEVLLAQGVRNPGSYYSLIAGFVEPGETLEEAVARETFEETGLRICDIEYQKSQPWPFSYNLMMGFTARYHSGTLKIAEDELIQANWFREDNLPLLSPKPTISRQLIDNFWSGRKPML